MSSEDFCYCLFCNCTATTSTLYDINGNSVLIGSQLIDFEDVIFQIFLKLVNTNTTNYICEECKDQLVLFYVFKEYAKQNLSSGFFDNAIQEMKEFFTKNRDKEDDLEVESTEREFVMRIKGNEEFKVLKLEAEEEEEILYEETDVHSQISSMDEEEGTESVNGKFYTDEQLQDDENDSINRKTISESSLTHQNHEEDTEMKIIVDNLDSKDYYSCECGEVFESAKELQSHSRARHKRKSSNVNHNEQLNCDQCGIIFKDIKYYKQHEKAHESYEAIAPQLPVYHCSDCQFLFSNEEDLVHHMSMHENKMENPEESLIERFSAFEDHFVYKPPRDEDMEMLPEDVLLICGHCGKRKEELELKIHLLIFHTCTICCPLDNRGFEGHKQVRFFADHIKNKHPEIFNKKVEYLCTICSARFATPFEKLAHMKTCKMKQYVCEKHCGKRFKSEWLLNKHLKLIEMGGEKRFTCNLCPKQCVSRSDLQIHVRSHTNERPYVCTICNKAFKTSANRSSHMDIHREEKVHQCKVCRTFFQTRPILRKHMKKHDEAYQSQCICQICKNKSYINRTHLLRHIKSSHSAPDLTIEQIDEFFRDFVSKKCKEEI